MAEVVTSATSQVDPRAAMMYPLVKVMCKKVEQLFERASSNRLQRG